MDQIRAFSQHAVARGQHPRQAGPPLVGTVAAALTLVPLTALGLMRATRPGAPNARPGSPADQTVEAGRKDIV
jgi:DHA1 family inner membrane transport protein